jgi:hypothetical protein
MDEIRSLVPPQIGTQGCPTPDQKELFPKGKPGRSRSTPAEGRRRSDKNEPGIMLMPLGTGNTVGYHLALFESARTRDRQSKVTDHSQSERRCPEVYQLRTVLRRYAAASNISYEDLLENPASELKGGPDRLKEYFKNQNVRGKQVTNYPYLLSKFMQETGVFTTPRPGQSRYLGALTPEWADLRESLRGKIDRQALHCFTSLGAWASEKDFSPAALAQQVNVGFAYREWLKDQAYKYPGHVYGGTRRALACLASSSISPAIPQSILELPEVPELSLPVVQWPAKLRDSFAPIERDWRSPNRVTKKFAGKYSPETIDTRMGMICR